MDKYVDYSVRAYIRRFLENKDIRVVYIILSVEFGMFLLTGYKGYGISYLPVVLFMMAFTVVGCEIAFYFQADRILLIIVILLMNLGFMVQQIQSKGNSSTGSFLMKLLIATMAALVGAFLYSKLSRCLMKDISIKLMMGGQLLICLVMLLGGKVIGGSQGATISFGGITPFEFVKAIYIFVAAGLLCSESTDEIHFFSVTLKREIALVLHTMILSVFFVLCSELGTLMIVYLTGLIMMWLFGQNRRAVIVLVVISILGFLFIWFLCTAVLLPLVMEHPDTIPGVAAKLIKRFGTALHPEQYMSDFGYQGTRGLEAISVGGWLGIGTERYRIILPEAANDFIFANVIETCGVLMGFLLIMFFFTFLRRGIHIAERCENIYYEGLTMAISVAIVTEAVIHIGYNLAILPITGIPLYFVSQGFTAIVTGMVLLAVMLVISAEHLENPDMYMDGKYYEDETN